MTDLQKRSEDLTFREMKFAGVLQLGHQRWVGLRKESRNLQFPLFADESAGARALWRQTWVFSSGSDLSFRFFDLLKWTLLDPAWWPDGGGHNLFSLQGNREQNYNDGEKLLLNFLHF